MALVVFASAAKVLVGHGLFAVGAEPAGSDATAEQVAILASVGPEVSGGTTRALIDGGIGPDLFGVGPAGGLGVTGPIAGLAAGVAVEPSPTGCNERGPTPGALGHDHIVTLS